MNLEIRQFQNDLINSINASDLPIEVKRLVLAEILEQVNTEAKRIINIELAEMQKGQGDAESTF